LLWSHQLSISFSLIIRFIFSLPSYPSLHAIQQLSFNNVFWYVKKRWNRVLNSGMWRKHAMLLIFFDLVHEDVEEYWVNLRCPAKVKNFTSFKIGNLWMMTLSQVLLISVLLTLEFNVFRVHVHVVQPHFFQDNGKGHNFLCCFSFIFFLLVCLLIIAWQWNESQILFLLQKIS
jgi:hypothetical protein